jgi:predicted DNA-binding transcriptional regulator AlpA
MEEELLNPAEIAARLKVKPSWVYEQTRVRAGIRNTDPFPHIKMGRLLRFDWNDVWAWIQRQKTSYRPQPA